MNLTFQNTWKNRSRNLKIWKKDKSLLFRFHCGENTISVAAASLTTESFILQSPIRYAQTVEVKVAFQGKRQDQGEKQGHWQRPERPFKWPKPSQQFTTSGGK